VLGACGLLLWTKLLIALKVDRSSSFNEIYCSTSLSWLT
jgi:hypothetical protein